jgi:hypothetical protein
LSWGFSIEWFEADDLAIVKEGFTPQEGWDYRQFLRRERSGAGR